MTARVVNANPKTNAGVVGFGDICSPHGSTLVPVPVPVPVCRTFRGPNRRRCVNCFTLGMIIILMEIIKDPYASTLAERVPVLDSGPQLKGDKATSDSDGVLPPLPARPPCLVP